MKVLKKKLKREADLERLNEIGEELHVLKERLKNLNFEVE